MSSSATSFKRPRINPLVKGEMGGGGSKVWSEITELARLPSIVSDLGQGYPDFIGDAIARNHVKELLSNNARLNQYSLVNGTLDCRKSLSEFYSKQGIHMKSWIEDKNILLIS